MEQIIDNNYDQIWELVKRLPYRDKRRLSTDIERVLAEKKERPLEKSSDLSDLQKLLLQGPTMSDEQFDDFKSDSFIGMWRDRDEMADSSAWVQNQRSREWESQNTNNG